MSDAAALETVYEVVHALYFAVARLEPWPIPRLILGSRRLSILLYVVKASFGHELVETLWWRHRRLDGQAAHVLPAFFEQTDQVVDSQHDIRDELVLRHANVANCYTEAQDFLQLELDGRLDLGDLGRQIFVVRDGRREFTSWEGY